VNRALIFVGWQHVREGGIRVFFEVGYFFVPVLKKCLRSMNSQVFDEFCFTFEGL
jgi:hypothetical protein